MTSLCVSALTAGAQNRLESAATACGGTVSVISLILAGKTDPAKRFFAVYGEVLNRCSRPVDLVDLDLQETLGRRILAGANAKRVA